jgi:glycosyltransferase involved in cell wall biosynthesis
LKKIFHLSNTNIAVDSRILKELAAVAARADVEVTAIGVPDGAGSPALGIPGVRSIPLKLYSRRLSMLPRAVRYFLEMNEFTLCAVLASLKVRPELVHCHDTFALPAGWLLKTLTGCKLVYDAHELESDKNGQNAALKMATWWIERFCWSKVDLLISVSDAILEWYTRHLPSKPTALVLNSPLISAEQETVGGHPKTYFHDKFGIPPDHQVFVYLGILAPGRGIEICLEAFARTTGKVCVVFVGFGPLERLVIERAQGSKRIFFHAAVAHDQVVNLVSHADFGLCLIENVSLSDYLCLPNKLFEYAFAGLPILASDFPEIQRVITRYSLGVCCKPNIADLTQTLSAVRAETLRADRDNLRELSWQVQAERLRTAYSALLNS